jgi:tetratricopeptide (TPR) repeat protein
MKEQKFIPLLVAAVMLLAYQNSFTGPFVFDDVGAIPQNNTIRHLWQIWDVLSPPASAGVGGRPVVNFSFALNYAFGGTSVSGYHALNLVIHILAALTLFGIVWRTLLQPSLSKRFGAVAQGLALATAIIWAVHPLQTEAVTYISQRSESLMGLFYLLTLYCFIRGTESQGAGPWFVLSVVACLLGMATKEVMVTAPLMVLLYDRTFVAGSFRAAWTQRWRVYLGLGCTWFLLGFLMAGLHRRGVGYGLGITWQEYPLTECLVVVKYIWLALWPHPLIFDYAMVMNIQHAAGAIPYALILVLLAAGVVVALKRWPAIGFIGAWFYVILAPTSTVVPIAYQPMAESRMYLPLAAIVVLAVMAIYALAGRRTVAVATMLAVGLGVLTWRRNEDYRSALAIWGDTVAKWPENPRAHNNFGDTLSQIGNVTEAIRQYEQAVRLKPDYAEAQNNLGATLGHTGRMAESIEHLEQALRIDPNYAEARSNFANALRQSGRVPEAIEQYEQALKIDPNMAGTHYNLAATLEQTGRLPDAIGHYEQALRIDPEMVGADFTLGLALMRVGRFQDALRHFDQALRIKPDLVEAQNGLAWLLATLPPAEGGDPLRAVTLAQRVCELTHNRAPMCLDVLGAAYAAAGRLNDAIATAQKAIELARVAGQPQVVKGIEMRLQLYRAGRAYRQPIAASSSRNP